MRAFIFSVILLGTSSLGVAAEDISKYGQWITGDMFTKDDLALFKADKPVQGNKTGDIVLIGPTKDSANIMGPLLMRAAELKVKLRFYGVLMQATELPGHHKGLPSVQFIVWKLHAPTDPDDLPPGQAV